MAVGDWLGLTEKEKDWIAEKYLKGHSQREISRVLYCSDAVIHRILRDRGVKREPLTREQFLTETGGGS